MSGYLRRAGRAILADGRELAWSVADGGRGRRWRAAVGRAGRLDASMLLEVGTDGRPARLELATPAGLLTLHPEEGGGLHGNAVTTAGVEHLAFPWGADHGVEVVDLVIPSAVTAARLRAVVPVGEGRDVPVVVVEPDLTVRVGERRYVRRDGETWTIEAEDGAETLVVDRRGIPVLDPAGVEWPLELQDGP